MENKLLEELMQVIYQYNGELVKQMSEGEITVTTPLGDKMMNTDAMGKLLRSVIIEQEPFVRDGIRKVLEGYRIENKGLDYDKLGKDFTKLLNNSETPKIQNFPLTELKNAKNPE